MVRISAKLNSLRIAPRKVRLITDLIKGKEVMEAENKLLFATKRASHPIAKLLKSARANAEHNAKISQDDKLIVRDIRVDEGFVFKRYMPRARGRATTIRKKTSNVTLVLESAEKKEK